MKTFNPWSSTSNSQMQNGNGLNLNNFAKFLNVAKGKGLNGDYLLQQIKSSGKYSDEQIQQATEQAQQIMDIAGNDISSLFNRLFR